MVLSIRCRFLEGSIKHRGAADSLRCFCTGSVPSLTLPALLCATNSLRDRWSLSSAIPGFSATPTGRALDTTGSAHRALPWPRRVTGNIKGNGNAQHCCPWAPSAPPPPRAAPHLGSWPPTPRTQWWTPANWGSKSLLPTFDIQVILVRQ